MEEFSLTATTQQYAGTVAHTLSKPASPSAPSRPLDARPPQAPSSRVPSAPPTRMPLDPNLPGSRVDTPHELSLSKPATPLARPASGPMLRPPSNRASRPETGGRSRPGTGASRPAIATWGLRPATATGEARVRVHQYNLEKPDEDTMSAVNTHMSSTYEAPPVRTMRKAFQDRSAYINEYDYLVGIEHPPESYVPCPDMSKTIFHKGFNRRRVEGQAEARAEMEDRRMLKSEEHHERRHARLAGFTKHRFLAADQEQVQGMDEWKPAKKSFHVPTSLRLAGPESVQPLGPDMGTRRMRTLLREGRVKPHEGVGDILKNPFAFD